jgi:hypothetical protein
VMMSGWRFSASLSSTSAALAFMPLLCVTSFHPVYPHPFDSAQNIACESVSLSVSRAASSGAIT